MGQSHCDDGSRVSLTLEAATPTAPRPDKRQRQQSLPLNGQSAELDPAFALQHMHLHDRGSPGEERRDASLRRLLRRASVSLKTLTQRRHSHATITDDRPLTPPSSTWHKLRQAASFSRHSRLLPPTFDDDETSDLADYLSPATGSYCGPPVIPHGSGHAARATAAAQNDYLSRNRQLGLPEDQQNDGESGIGIALTTLSERVQTDEADISRVDFIASLPVELGMHILSHLDHQSLASALRVSTGWAKLVDSPHIWRQAFLREKSKTYAMSRPIEPGTGLGIPSMKPDTDWKDLYRMRQHLEQNWMEGKAEPVYLNGHLDSIYCVQFDEYVLVVYRHVKC